MSRLLSLGFSIILLAGLGASFSSSTSFVQADPNNCEGVDVGEAEANVSVNDSTISVEGLYCARNGGFTVEDETLSKDGDQIEVSISIEGLDEGMAGTTAITPVNFNMADEFDPEEYDLAYEVEVDGEIIESGEKEIQIGEIEETSGFLVSLSNWLTGLF